MGLSDRYYQPPDVFDPDPIGEVCPECDCEIDDEIYCQACGAVLDENEAAAIAKEEAEERIGERIREEGRRLP